MRNDLHEQKVDLACALRWADRLGFSEGICDHFSLAVDEKGETFLVNPQGLHWSEICASDIVLCRHDGEVLEVNQVVAYFCYVNRVVLGLGVHTDGETLGLAPRGGDDDWSHG